jgi:GntR family transcriptional regulator
LEGAPVIEFHVDTGSGVPPYRQIVQQVRQALRLGMLVEGDQLPTVKEVVAQVAINPNTVLKAYRELELEGLVAGRPGLGTFATRSLDGPSPRVHQSLRKELAAWMAKGRHAGLDDDGLRAVFDDVVRTAAREGVA